MLLILEPMKYAEFDDFGLRGWLMSKEYLEGSLLPLCPSLLIVSFLPRFFKSSLIFYRTLGAWEDLANDDAAV
jgi:hypothetical protein